jgi:hypothetical protein
MEKYAQVPIEELQAEQEQIEKAYLTTRFAQQIRQTSIACYKQCGGTMTYPFKLD